MHEHSHTTTIVHRMFRITVPYTVQQTFRLGLLHMSEFQFCVATYSLNPVHHRAWRVLVTPECMLALRHCRAPLFLVQGVPLGAVLSRKKRSPLMPAWRAGGCSGCPRIHIIFLKLSVVFLYLKCFLLFLQRHYVLIQTDNTMMVTYKLMGGLRYFHLHLMVCRLIRWEYNRFLSGRRMFHICPTNISKFTLLSFNMLKHDKLILLLRSA